MMMETTGTRVQIPAVNAVEGFEPASFTRQIPTEDGSMSLYLDVKFRMLWFRLRFPNGKLDTEIQAVTDQYAVVCCRVYTDKTDPADQYVARSMAQRFVSQDRFGDRFLELAETAAIGRALAAAGFGTQFCSPADIPNDISDSPLEEDFLPGGGSSCGMTPNGSACETQEAVRSAAQQFPGCQYIRQPQQPVREPEQTVSAAADAPMTLEQAKKVVVDFGKYKGSTLGQVAMMSPGDLQWYVERYVGSNKALKEGAALLVNAARRVAV